MDSLVRGVGKRFSGFATRTTKRTTALAVKLVGKSLRIAVCPAYCDRTGRGRSRNSRPSSVVRFRFASAVQSNDPKCTEAAHQAFGMLADFVGVCQCRADNSTLIE